MPSKAGRAAAKTARVTDKRKHQQQYIYIYDIGKISQNKSRDWDGEGLQSGLQESSKKVGRLKQLK